MNVFGREIPLNKKLLLSLAAAIAFIPIIIALSVWQSLNQPIAIPEESITIEVRPGSSLTTIANNLHSLNLVESPQLLTLYGRITGIAASLQSGEYELTTGTTPIEFLQKMSRGDTLQYRITLVEGWTLQQALKEIWSNTNIERTIENNIMIAELLEIEADSAEGLLFPDTYFFIKGSTDIDILSRANQRLEEVLEQAWENRLGALPYEDSYDALILASIIEKESAQGSERGHIAGVFVRRLEQGMRLQSDPTVIYGMGDDYDGDIRREDLQEETAYNTYRINGLPPTPIALSGIESIQASMNPLPSDYLYFVSRGDGTHYFSATLEEHNAAVNEYQRQ